MMTRTLPDLSFSEYWSWALSSFPGMRTEKSVSCKAMGPENWAVPFQKRSTRFEALTGS